MAEKEKNSDDVAKRLARIAGHAASLQRLWEEGRDSDQMLTQISAVRAALDKAAKTILKYHIEHTVDDAVERGKSEKAIKSLKDALDRLM